MEFGKTVDPTRQKQEVKKTGDEEEKPRIQGSSSPQLSVARVRVTGLCQKGQQVKRERCAVGIRLFSGPGVELDC